MMFIEMKEGDKMDPHLKADWIEALRSGEFKQGKTHLKADGAYCCLGVLCEIHPEIKVEPAYELSEEGDVWCAYSHNKTVRSSAYLPALETRELISKWDQTTLAHKNDLGDTFDEIADWIEMHL